MKLNVGCGLDYKEGYVNIDGSSVLPSVDKVIDFNTEALGDHFAPGSVQHILCQDFLEHFFHWEAVSMLASFFEALQPEGTVEIRVPDSEFIINSAVPIESKLRSLYGGQDVQQGAMDFSRAEYPQFFCHKYGWTRDRLGREMEKLGFTNLEFAQLNSNFVTTGTRA